MTFTIFAIHKHFRIFTLFMCASKLADKCPGPKTNSNHTLEQTQWIGDGTSKCVYVSVNLYVCVCVCLCANVCVSANIVACISGPMCVFLHDLRLQISVHSTEGFISFRNIRYCCWRSFFFFVLLLLFTILGKYFCAWLLIWILLFTQNVSNKFFSIW